MLSDYLADVESDGGAYKPSTHAHEPMPIFDHNEIETPAPEKFDLGTLSASKKSEGDPTEGSMADADTDKFEEAQESDVPVFNPSVPVFKTVKPDSPRSTLQQLKETQKRFGVKLEAVKDLEAELGLPHSESSESDSDIHETFVDAPAYQPEAVESSNHAEDSKVPEAVLVQNDGEAGEDGEGVQVNMEDALQAFIEEVQQRPNSQDDLSLKNLDQSIDHVSSRLAHEAVDAYLKDNNIESDVAGGGDNSEDVMDVDSEEDETNANVTSKIPKVTVHTLDLRNTDTPSDEELAEGFHDTRGSFPRPGYPQLKFDGTDDFSQYADQHNDTDDSLSYVSAIETENSSAQASRQASSVSIQLVNNKELPFEVIKKAQKDPRHIVPISVDQEGKKYEMAPCPAPGGYNVTLKEVSTLDNKEPSVASLSSIIVHPPHDSVASTATSTTNDQDGRHTFGASSAHAGHGNISGDKKTSNTSNADSSAEAGPNEGKARATAEADANKTKDGKAEVTAEASSGSGDAKGKAEATAKADTNSGDGKAKAKAKADSKSDKDGDQASAEADSKSEGQGGKSSASAEAETKDLHAQAFSDALSDKNASDASAEASSSSKKRDDSQSEDEEKSRDAESKPERITDTSAQQPLFTVPEHQAQPHEEYEPTAEHPPAGDTHNEIEQDVPNVDYVEPTDHTTVEVPEDVQTPESEEMPVKPDDAIEIDNLTGDEDETKYEDAEHEEPLEDNASSRGEGSPELDDTVEIEPSVEQSSELQEELTIGDADDEVEAQSEEPEQSSEAESEEDAEEDAPLVVEPEGTEPMFVVYESSTVVEGVEAVPPTFIEEPQADEESEPSDNEKDISDAVEEIVTDLLSHLDEELEYPTEVIEPEEVVDSVVEVFEETTDVIQPSRVDELDSIRNTPEPVDSTVLVEEVDEHRGQKRAATSLLSSPAKKIKSVAGKLNPLRWFSSDGSSRPSSASSDIPVPELVDLDEDEKLTDESDVSYYMSTSDELEEVVESDEDIEVESSSDLEDQLAADLAERNVTQEIGSTGRETDVGSLPVDIETLEATDTVIEQPADVPEEEGEKEVTESPKPFIDQLGDAIVDEVADDEIEQAEKAEEPSIEDQDVNEEPDVTAAEAAVDDAIEEVSNEVVNDVVDDIADQVAEQVAEQVADDVVDDIVDDALEEAIVADEPPVAEQTQGNDDIVDTLEKEPLVDDVEGTTEDVVEDVANQVDEEVVDDIVEKAATEAADIAISAQLNPGSSAAIGDHLTSPTSSTVDDAKVEGNEAGSDEINDEIITEAEEDAVPSNIEVDEKIVAPPAPPKPTRPWSAASLESMSELDEGSVPVLPQFNIIAPTLERLAAEKEKESVSAPPEVREEAEPLEQPEKIEEADEEASDSKASVSRLIKLLGKKANARIDQKHHSSDDTKPSQEEGLERKEEENQEEEPVAEPEEPALPASTEKASPGRRKNPRRKAALKAEEPAEEPAEPSAIEQPTAEQPEVETPQVEEPEPVESKPEEPKVEEPKAEQSQKKRRGRPPKVKREAEAEAESVPAKRLTRRQRKMAGLPETEEPTVGESKPDEEPTETTAAVAEKSEQPKANEDVAMAEENVDAKEEQPKDDEAPKVQPRGTRRSTRRAAKQKEANETNQPADDAVKPETQQEPPLEATKQEEPQPEPPKRKGRGRKRKIQEAKEAPAAAEQKNVSQSEKAAEPKTEENAGPRLQPELAEKIVANEEETGGKRRSTRVRRSTRHQDEKEAEPMPSSPVVKADSPKSELAPGFEPQEQLLSPTKRRGRPRKTNVAQSSPSAEFSPPMPKLRTASGSRWHLDLLDHPALRTRSKSPIKRTIQELSLDMEEEQPKRRRRNVKKDLQPVDAEEKRQEEEGRGRRRRRD